MSDIVKCTCGANKDDCIDCMRAEIERLRGALTQTSEAWSIGQNTIAQLRAAIEVRERDHREKTAEIERLRSEVNQEIVARRVVEDKLEEAGAEIERLKAENRILTETITVQESLPEIVYEEKETEIERLRASERSAWNAAVERDKEIERLRDQIPFPTYKAAAEAEIGRLRADNNVLDAEAAKAINGLCDANRKIEQLRRLLGNSEELIKKLRELVRELAAQVTLTFEEEARVLEALNDE